MRAPARTMETYSGRARSSAPAKADCAARRSMRVTKASKCGGGETPNGARASFMGLPRKRFGPENQCFFRVFGGSAIAPCHPAGEFGVFGIAAMGPEIVQRRIIRVAQRMR